MRGINFPKMNNIFTRTRSCILISNLCAVWWWAWLKMYSIARSGPALTHHCPIRSKRSVQTFPLVWKSYTHAYTWFSTNLNVISSVGSLDPPNRKKVTCNRIPILPYRYIPSSVFFFFPISTAQDVTRSHDFPNVGHMADHGPVRAPLAVSSAS